MPYGTDHTCKHGEPWGDCPLGCNDPVYLRKQQLEKKLVEAADLDVLPVPVPIVSGVLYLDSLAWLQGRPGSGKSFVALDIAACVSVGIPWQGYPTPVDSEGYGPRVLYVVAEGTAGLRQRVRAWEAAYGQRMLVTFLPVAVQAASPADWDALINIAADWYSLIIIDTQARSTVGMEENSARDMGHWVQQLDRLREATEGCVVVVHHQGRAGEHMRGSTAMEGAATSVLQVSKEDDLVTVKCLKQKDAAPFDDLELRLIARDSSMFLALTAPSTMDSIGSILAERWLSLWWERFESDEVSVTGLVNAGVVTEATFHRRKFPLVRAGFVTKEGNGRQVRYRLMKDPRP